MKNKKILIVVLVLILILIGYFVFNRAKPQNTEETPTDTATQGKININVVCEGALAYMTFEDGASADKFVADCKEGKYPEVIEEYKKQMNLGEGAEI